MKLLLDTNVIARICHPRQHRDVQVWFYAIVSRRPPDHEILVSAISLYELQRALAGAGATASMEQFQRLSEHLQWLPVTSEVTQRAAELWSEIGRESVLSDADLVIAAQALLEGAVLVTADKQLKVIGRRLGLDVRDWAEIDPNVP